MGGRKPDLRVFPESREAAEQCAIFIANELQSRISEKGVTRLAVSGGTTPKPMFQALAKAPLDWSKVHVFFVDERCVPPTSDQSNFKMAKENLLSGAPLLESNVHRIHGELNPDEAAGKYINEVKGHFELSDGALPVFDVLHRGMGSDAHTASLFPGEPLIADRTGIAAHVWVDKLKMDRVTLLPGVLLKAVRTVLEISGPDKAEPLHEVLYGPDDPFRFPCQIAARGSDTAVWFLDQAAAAKI
ncbi:MAG TPA: 6-phosphogluconolactonase [Bryobacteraceae bacterium]|jgi:6-phosphogluconolactonase|nr:6-phosphogluconolactonase [Bryobacteraceae bacterium]